MTPAEILSNDLAEAAQELRDKDEPFAFAIDWVCLGIGKATTKKHIVSIKDRLGHSFSQHSRRLQTVS
ncbi:hypothetical protein [uncultured Tateyamaria sp.]|uniref:hypothetical protein n=1 Tax=uncultured Tateyamaria sp. TaxID=455651 RepID=UPI00260E2964|nr:hypothetical protein [uncultured Tateyamaria sp.]